MIGHILGPVEPTHSASIPLSLNLAKGVIEASAVGLDGDPPLIICCTIVYM